MLYPMLMTPYYKDVTWGGTRLKELYNKPITSDKTGESWEISAREDHPSYIANGEFKGISLYDLYNKYPEEISGRKNMDFPWLVKLLDAHDSLSVQVHPDNDYAVKNGDVSGKTEMWYILDCNEDSRLIAGFNDDVTADTVIKTALDGTIAKHLNSVPVKKGDIFFIPPGTVHAIGAGIVILEIQQNSDATYRLFDWNRRDKDGNLRPLHIEKASDVAITTKSTGLTKAVALGNGEELLCECEFFRAVKRAVEGKSVIKKEMTGLMVTKGSFKLNDLELKAGDSVLIPYCAGDTLIEGKGEIVLLTMPCI